MMKVISAAAAVLAVACIFAATSATAFETEGNVIIGTDDNLDQILAENEFALVEFYAPWCGHCKALEPEYAEAADTVAERGIPAVLVKVDATVQEQSAQRFQISGYPTIKFFANGKDSEFQGGRTAAEIVQFLNKKTGPPATAVSTVDEVVEFAKTGEVVYIGLFKSVSSEDAAAFTAVASESEYQFAISENAEIAAHYGVEVPAIVCLRTFDEPQVNFNGEFTADEVASFVNSEAVPLVIEFTGPNTQKIFSSPIKTHLLVFASASGFEALEASVSAAAAQVRGIVLTIFVNAESEENARVLEFFQIADSDLPDVRLINIDDHIKKFALAGDVTEEALVKFVEDYQNGNLKPFLKSEPVPEDWDAEPVKVLTGENFNEVVNSDKIVFVEFYAPWCGHCKQLTPIWDQLALAFEGVDNVVVAKIDATANEIEEHPVEGFPTLKLFQNGQPSEYEGGRTIGDLVEFLNENAGTSVTAPAADDTVDDFDNYDDYYDDAEADAGNGAGHDEL